MLMQSNPLPKPELQFSMGAKHSNFQNFRSRRLPRRNNILFGPFFREHWGGSRLRPPQRMTWGAGRSPPPLKIEKISNFRREEGCFRVSERYFGQKILQCDH